MSLDSEYDPTNDNADNWCGAFSAASGDLPPQRLMMTVI